MIRDKRQERGRRGIKKAKRGRISKWSKWSGWPRWSRFTLARHSQEADGQETEIRTRHDKWGNRQGDVRNWKVRRQEDKRVWKVRGWKMEDGK